MNKPQIIVILGPTAVGKTALALALAEQLSCEIISADSMQIYRGMDIGTAKPSLDEQKQVKHHLIDIINPDQKFTVADFVSLAEKCIQEILRRRAIPLITGGTGLYINALVDGFLFPDKGADESLRKQLYKVAASNPKLLYRRLMTVDSKSAAKYHPNDTKRVIRALEVYYTQGKTISELQAKMETHNQKYKPVMIGLTRDRQILYQRIDQRVDTMMQMGLISEVRELLQKYPIQPTALQAIGYKEIASYLRKELSLDEAVKLIKRETRRYAKRQISWFKRDKRIRWYDLENASNAEIIRETKQRIKNE